MGKLLMTLGTKGQAGKWNPASGTQLGSAQTMNATFFFGGFAVSGSVCTISVGTAE